MDLQIVHNYVHTVDINNQASILLCVYVNALSIVNKMSELQIYVYELNPYIILLLNQHDSGRGTNTARIYII